MAQLIQMYLESQQRQMEIYIQNPWLWVGCYVFMGALVAYKVYRIIKQLKRPEVKDRVLKWLETNWRV